MFLISQHVTPCLITGFVFDKPFMTQHLRTYPDHLYYDILWYKEQSLHFTFYHLPCAPLYHKDM